MLCPAFLEDLEKSPTEAIDSYEERKTKATKRNYFKVRRHCFELHLTNLISKSCLRLIYLKKKKELFFFVKIIVYIDWCQERKITPPLLKMKSTELDQNLARFFVQARPKKVTSTVVQLFSFFAIPLNDT